MKKQKKAKEMTIRGLHKQVLKNVPLTNKKHKSLDLASGQGALVEKISKKGWDCTACDLDTSNFVPKDISCKKINLNDKFPFKTNQFELVTATEVIEHIENPWQFMREIHKVLKKDGIAIITTPNNEFWLSRLIFFFTRKLYYFTERNYLKSGHITPIYSWNFERMIEGKFTIEKLKFSRNRIPLLRIDLPFKSISFGENLIYVLRKK